jgi:hypothetical protein
MALKIFFYFVIPLLPVIEKIFKKTWLSLTIYYLIVIIFISAFFKNWFVVSNNSLDIFSLFKSAGVIFFPLIFFFSIKQNNNVVKIIYYFLYYFIFPLVLIYNIYIWYKFGWTSKIAVSETLASDFFLGIYTFGSVLILLPTVIYDKLKYGNNKK